ncbi:unnamed protein product [Phytomonas sp. EM1]|nr:unnamed protein product [Phytomonas sp. EM1]|eukprot:CCW63417.1 unnamed protein product [Phytomonas sp. isolate EM1]
MTNYVRNVALTLTDKLIWRPAKGDDHVYDYIIQQSPSARARCRKCSQYINKGEFRCGIPVRFASGEYGWISAWQHLGCTRIEESEDLTKVMHGFAQLEEMQRKEIISEVTSSETPEHLRTLDPDDLIKRRKLEEAETPKEVLRTLLPYQREGLNWMLAQECSDAKGGILADEMGMGKTIQMISLLVAHPVPGPTLIVCPVSSMLQWESEIKEHVVSGKLAVLVAYKTSKLKREDMENADVVLTTYPMIEQAWRLLVNRTKVPCPYCGQLFLVRQLIVHNKYFCSPNAKKTMKQLKREKGKGDMPNSRKFQSEATVKKGLRTLHIEVDNTDESDIRPMQDQNASESKSKSIMGPMGMYQELMREAGRTVRSRWERARTHSSGSESDSSDDSAETSSMEFDSAAQQAEEEEAAHRKAEELAILDSFRCDKCNFQFLRYPFCPKTGQYHIIPEALRKMTELDTGGDKVDLNASIFHSVSWSRIVLDEAHRIKGRTTSTARSAFALEAEYRWCLTGTPLQNRVGDVYSLLRFLRIKPYSHYFCGVDGCSCSSLSHPFSGTSLHECIFCGHGPVQHYSYFNRLILNPINRYGYIGEGRKGMMLLSNDVFSKVMLRRTKMERIEDLHLPPLEIKIRRIQLSNEERNFYEALYKKCTAEFDTFVSKGTILHNYAHIFQLLSRLRQALDHPLLVMRGMNLGPVVYEKGLCGICGEGVEGERTFKAHPCRHTFHCLCLSQFLESAPDRDYHCPICFVRINVDLRQLRVEWDEDEDAGAAALPPELQEMDDEECEQCDGTGASENGEDETRAGTTDGNMAKKFQNAGRGKASTNSSSVKSTKKDDRSILSRLDPNKPLHGTKLDAITNYIEQIPTDEKIIVFSQLGDMLDLTQYWLQKRFVKSVKLCGSLTLSQRQAVLQAFLHDPTVRVILISLKAGGEGLNLQIANHVVLIDPWWNPAVEMQAVQRAHRIGQTKPVDAVRFVTENSIEERMVELQNKKMLVFEGTIDGKMQSLNKLSEEDLQFLFTR